MLYRNILLIPYIVLNSLHTCTDGTTYNLTNGRSECPGTSTDTCHIFCDQSELDSQTRTFSCANAGQCYFHCEEKKCISSGYVNGSNAHHLYVDISAQECMKYGTVYTPSNGNATFTMSANKGFKGMSIESGSNTQNIIINCVADTDGKDDCKEMSINAPNANYLEITVANALEFEKSKVVCPVDSTYNGPSDAPCVLRVFRSGIVKDVTVYTSQGTPHDFVVVSDDTAEISSDNPLTLVCDNGSDEFPFSSSSTCWNTMSPTMKPTNNPSSFPTTSTTVHPTVYPSATPTKNPTQHPLTGNPTLNPTVNPTQLPTTDNPTLSAHVDPIITTPSPINEGQVATMSGTEFNQATGAKHKASDGKSFWDQQLGISVEIVLISIGVLLVICCICLFLCYWYRQETVYKELLYVKAFEPGLSKSLMLNGSDSDEPVSMQIFDQIDIDVANNNLLAPKSQQNFLMKEYSIDSDESYSTPNAREAQIYKVTLSGPKKSHFESISLCDDEPMDVQDLEIVDDCNKTHGALMRVGSGMEGMQRNAVDTECTVLPPGTVDLQMSDEEEALAKTDTHGFIE
eukprot:66535_1